jgi:hypothetical protein
MRTWDDIAGILAPFVCKTALVGNAMYGYPINRFATETIEAAIVACKAAARIITAEGNTDEAADLRAGLFLAIDRCNAEIARRAA